MTANKGAVLYGAKDLRIATVDYPKPNDDEVLLSMGTVGICGSDTHIWQNGRISRHVLKRPMILGHEGAGTVIKVGSKVKHLKAGDRVAVEPGIPCRRCHWCKSGRYNLCPEIKFCATPPVDGNMCRFYKHAADFCYKLPDNVSMDEGAMLEPLSVAVYACRRGGVGPGSAVLITGAGPIGLMITLVARSAGAANILVTGNNDYRIQLAKDIGADHVMNVKNRKPEEVSDQIEVLMGCQPDIMFECSGSESAVQLGFNVMTPGGSVVRLGISAPDMTLPIGRMLSREIDFRSVRRYANCYPSSLQLIASGRIDVKPLITHHFSFNQVIKALETAKSRDKRAIKVLIHCDQ